MRRRIIRTLIPWLITLLALSYAFSGLEWHEFVSHLRGVELWWILAAISLTVLSYLSRAFRWLYLFPEAVLKYWQAFSVLILGFFMNNVLPARAGELVRAHAGARVTGHKRTLVLATIASERLLDGVTISLILVFALMFLDNNRFSIELLYVALVFFAALIVVFALLRYQHHLFHIGRRVHHRFDNRVSHYGLDRLQVFIGGLAPLTDIRRTPRIIIWSFIVWGVELLVYFSVAFAFHYQLDLATSVIFLAAVNFSSLIPSAPAGLGVIEAIATQVLVAVGVPKELALSMVLTQHIIQFAVVGIIGATVGIHLQSRGLHQPMVHE